MAGGTQNNRSWPAQLEATSASSSGLPGPQPRETDHSAAPHYHRPFGGATFELLQDKATGDSATTTSAHVVSKLLVFPISFSLEVKGIGPDDINPV